MPPLNAECSARVEAFLAESVALSDVAEWVGLHYMRNFESESPQQRLDWVIRYLESHAEGQRMADNQVTRERG